MQLLELDDGFGDGWYLGKHLTTNGTGLFPGVYTTKAPTVRTPGHSPTPSQSQQLTPPPQYEPPLVTAPATIVTPLPESIDNVQPENDATSSSLPAPHHTTYVQRSIGEALGNHENGSDSPVMNETLNVIDEHITDLSTPRQTMNTLRVKEDSESEYSSHMDRRSFVAGPDTEDEEDRGLDEPTVRSWDHLQVAQHLLDLGVDPKHCEIFREQEITGDVLIDMDQNFIYMQEFDFGVMGRRLKTWHKVRDFQREVKFTPQSRRPSERGLSSTEDVSRPMRSGLSARPSYTPPIAEEESDFPHPLQPTQVAKRTSWAAPASNTHFQTTVPTESPVKAEASKSKHSRRHSSIDFGAQPDLGLSALQESTPNKNSSITGSWSVPGTGSTHATTPTSSIRPSTKAEDLLDIPSPTLADESPADFDRGYFSGNDVDNRRRNRLSKISQRGHSRQVSEQQQSKRTSIIKRHARLSSAGSIREDSAFATPAANAYHSQPVKTRFRSASVKATSGQSSPAGLSPAVTNLENDSTSNFGSPSLEKMRMQDRARKLMGFRATSEAITPDEKSNAIKLIPSADTSRMSDIVASPATGDTTPSATPSLDIESSDQVDMGAALGKSSSRPRPKSKQRTSAYTHGLLKIPPSEARKLCDYSGWMKKKSSGIMTTWKPRLFILRGRRLSYYYSENDTEERGIIDISGHKVLVANDDPIITLHASVTGASKASSTPRPDGTAASPGRSTTGVFYFKLVPPKTGMSRAVQFTKPAIHYFQVDTITEGRKWMGEIMKATIEHDLASFETTNKQKTISLAKARARRERPPELDDTKPKDGTRQSGLGIEISDTNSSLGEMQVSDSKVLPILAPVPQISLEDKQVDRLTNIHEDDKENAAAPTAVVPDTKA